jgi:hypothetical protein
MYPRTARGNKAAAIGRTRDMLKAAFIAALVGSACLTAPTVVMVASHTKSDVELISNNFSPVDRALECADIPVHARTALAAAYSRDVYTLITEVPPEHLVKQVTVDVVAHGCLVTPGEPLEAITKEQVLQVGPAAGFVEEKWMKNPKFYVVQELEPQSGGLKLVFRVITLPASSAFVPPAPRPSRADPVRIA